MWPIVSNGDSDTIHRYTSINSMNWIFISSDISYSSLLLFACLPIIHLQISSFKIPGMGAHPSPFMSRFIMFQTIYNNAVDIYDVLCGCVLFHNNNSNNNSILIIVLCYDWNCLRINRNEHIGVSEGHHSELSLFVSRRLQLFGEFVHDILVDDRIQVATEHIDEPPIANVQALWQNTTRIQTDHSITGMQQARPEVGHKDHNSPGLHQIHKKETTNNNAIRVNGSSLSCRM